ncbi:MAG: hypothetical protein LC104_02485 [Bacteroidales bacterium]|nr:hypothetical protein [Bacteroidales bacterium]
MPKSIWLLSNSIENDRPEIDFVQVKETNPVDWGLVDDLLHSKVSIEQYTPLNILVEQPEATKYDFYSVPGTLGLVSNRLVDAIGSIAFMNYSTLPVTLNDAQFYLVKCNATIDCLDHDNSDFERFRSAPYRIKRIKRYSFRDDMLSDQLVFTIPEQESLFITNGIYDSLCKYAFRGIALTKIV